MRKLLGQDSTIAPWWFVGADGGASSVFAGTTLVEATTAVLESVGMVEDVLSFRTFGFRWAGKWNRVGQLPYHPEGERLLLGFAGWKGGVPFGGFWRGHWRKHEGQILFPGFMSAFGMYGDVPTHWRELPHEPADDE